MELKTGMLYFISDDFFKKVNDPYLKINYETSDRPHYYALQDKKTSLYWLVPCSSKIEKFEAIIKKKQERQQHTDSIQIVNIQGVKSILLFQDMFPIIDKYIKEPYIKLGVPVSVSDKKILNSLDKIAKTTITLLRRGIKFTPTQPDAIRIEKMMLEEIQAQQQPPPSEKALEILSILDELYPTQVKCYLHFSQPYELLFSTILSAQCTDNRVNLVTPALFSKYPTLAAFAEADLADVESLVHATGFYHNKAKNIIAAARALISDFNSEVPSDIEALTSLPGVGRKTANVIRSHIFNLPSVVVDTHVARVSKRLGFTNETDPVKIEFALMKILPREHWSRFNTQIIAHGRNVCTARKPKCGECGFKDVCAEGRK